MFYIHASTLPYYNDCQRRGILNIIPKNIIEGLGVKLNTKLPHVASKLGTGAHAGVSFALNRKITGEIVKNPLEDIFQSGIESFREEIKLETVIWDNITNNLNTAEKQIQSILRAYYYIVLPEINPVNVEYRLKAKITDEFVLTGRMDADCGIEIRDYKSGARDPKSYTQLGTYAILKKTVDNVKTNKIGIDHIQRTKLNKPQEQPDTVFYNVEESIKSAKYTYKDIVDKMTKFLNCGDPNIFPENPHSKLCSQKYCIAHGTNWCKLTKG